jgi:hypothetical protein
MLKQTIIKTATIEDTTAIIEMFGNGFAEIKAYKGGQVIDGDVFAESEIDSKMEIFAPLNEWKIL